ncbi:MULTISPECIES: head GIN domain-containing protein [Rufibacter]|uniref:Putative auto-transporter adhesin head GIN domain-containing protein n=1 Tax=Rufibacter quisquiliarum TaxID=1549639 RepID=A0A839GGA8_9BACT|nr:MULTISPECIES: head GIN domain-containing protein [Rufibacter]MBA9077912.1 hypothetical protein [Rufibacter quisquiliarum]
MIFTRFFSSIAFLAVFLLLSACDILGDGPCLEGKGDVKAVTRDVSAFTGIDMRLPGNVHVVEGPVHSLTVETFHNLLPEIITEVVNNTLVIRSDACLEYFSNEATFYVSMPEIENVELKSSGEVRIVTVPSKNKLRLNLSGSGTIYYTGSTNSLNLLHSGSGDIVLVGNVGYIETLLSGSGRIQGYSMMTDTAKTVIAGSGYQQVWVSQVLDVSITGSGNLYYRGLPPSIVIYTSGSGKLINQN